MMREKQVINAQRGGRRECSVRGTGKNDASRGPGTHARAKRHDFYLLRVLRILRALSEKILLTWRDEDRNHGILAGTSRNPAGSDV